MQDTAIKVLVVEDSRSAAATLKHLLEPFDVVGVAPNGKAALEMVGRLRPDVITMDIHLPDMNGLDLTRQILSRRRVPIVVVSSMVAPDRQELVFEALRAGAYEVVAKSRLVSAGGVTGTGRRLIRLIRTAGTGRNRARRQRALRAVRASPAPAKAEPVRRQKAEGGVLTIGASTGGPAALRTLLGGLDAAFRLPVLVAQHMADGFIQGMVHWLNTQTGLDVRIAKEGEAIESGKVYFPPQGNHLTIGDDGRVSLVPCEGKHLPCPSVDLLFISAGKAFGDRAICLLLTGMGSDGSRGLLAARSMDARTAIQDEETSVIFGMPGQAALLGAAQSVLPLPKIAAWLEEQSQDI
jgi:two-component system chemotaxis response regulator CheB